LAQFSSGFDVFPSSIPAHSREISSKLAQFQNPSLPADEGVWLARVVHCIFCIQPES